MKRYTLIFLCLLGLVGCERRPASTDTPSQSREFKDLNLDPKIFGKDWKVSTCAVLDNLDDLENLPADEQMALVIHKGWAEPFGVIALANISLDNTKSLFNMIIVQVYKFKNSQLATDYFNKKYQSSGWQKEYNLVEGVSYFAVDSKDFKQRLVISNEYSIFAQHIGIDIGDDDLHLKALEVIMKQLGLP